MAEGGERGAQPPRTGERKRIIQAVNPATGERLGEVVAVTEEQVVDALRRARAAQGDWGGRTVRERVRALRPVLEVLVDRRDELAALISRETGKPRFEALVSEVFTTIEVLDYYLRQAEEVLAPKRIPHRILRTTRSYSYHEPFGVVGVITPWNYPFYLTASVAISALCAGNAVLNKPSEFTPLVGLEVEKVFRDAGLAPALYQCLPGYGEVGAALIEAGCDKISFTGSVATGRKVAAACGQRLIPVSLELGGKDPAIVLEDAPLERAVRSITWGAFCNAGQVCASVERVYVHQAVAREFTERLVEEVKRLRQGVDTDHETDLGSMANRQQFEVVREQVDEARARGARILIGGEGRAGTGDKAGYWYEPTVIADATPEMKVLRDETFGPVVALVTVPDEDEAVRQANDSPYGLTACVWTTDQARAERLARRLHFGSVYVNDALVPGGAGESTWGGVKHSGYGRSRGPQGLLEMVRHKHVSYDRLLLKDTPAWFPYTKEKYQLVSDLIPLLFGSSPVERTRAGLRGLRHGLRGIKNQLFGLAGR